MMNIRSLYFTFSVMAVCIVAAAAISGCATTEPPETADPQIVDTVAVLYFDNTSMTDRVGNDTSKKLITDVLITNLATVPGLAVVERSRLEDVLTELSVGTSELADRETQLRIGRLLGARTLLVGDYSVLGSILQINGRVIDVETARTVYSAEVMGPDNQIFQLAWMLVAKISTGLGAELPDAPKPGRLGPSVAPVYSQGLDLLDSGDYAGARRVFEQVLEDDPGNAGAQARIEEIETRE